MIDAPLAMSLRVVAWVLIIAGVLSRAVAFVESGSVERLPEWWPGAFGMIAELALPAGLGGVLLIALSIDERLKKRGQ